MADAAAVVAVRLAELAPHDARRRIASGRAPARRLRAGRADCHEPQIFEQVDFQILDSRDHQPQFMTTRAALQRSHSQKYIALCPRYRISSEEGESKRRPRAGDGAQLVLPPVHGSALLRAQDLSGLTPENYFGEEVAERYDETAAEMFDPACSIRRSTSWPSWPGGAALELGIGTGRIALPLARRGVRVHGIELSRGHGRAAAREAGRRRDRGDDRRLRDDEGRRHVLARLPRLQHDQEPDDAGRAGRVLPATSPRTSSPAGAS